MRILAVFSLIIPVVSAAANADDGFAVPKDVQAIVVSRCIECHSGDSAEGGVRFDTVGKLQNEERLELLNKAQEQLFFGLMPPEDAEQPGDAEREKLLDATVNRLIDHPGMRTIDGVKRNVVGDNGVNLGTRFGGHNLRQSITNPFLLPTNIGVRYYDTTAMTGGHLLTMISNAKKIAGYMSSEQAMKAHYPAMYRIMKMELAHRDILASRERFLNSYIENVALDIYKEENEALLPKFARIEVDEVKVPLDSKGNPKLQANMELLRTRYDRHDIQAIYRGIQEYKQDDVSYEEVIEKCEHDWFNFGVHEKRLLGRVTLMKIMGARWDMALIYEDVKKQNMALPPYRPLSNSEMQVIAGTSELCSSVRPTNIARK